TAFCPESTLSNDWSDGTAGVSPGMRRESSGSHDSPKQKGVTTMALLGTKLETRRDLYLFKLGAALTMEKTILDMLPQLEEEASHTELETALRMHHAQTENHVRNLEEAFTILGEDPDEKPGPAIEGLEKEGQATLKIVDDALTDAVIVSAVAETEHH